MSPRHNPIADPKDDATPRSRKPPKQKGVNQGDQKEKSGHFDRHGKRIDSGFGSLQPPSQNPAQIDNRRGSTVRSDDSTQHVPVEESAQVLPREVASKLSSLGREFAAIAEGNFPDCEIFIRENPDILRKTPKEFVAAAHAALQAGTRSVAKSCIQQSLLLQNLQDEDGEALPDEERERYLGDLVDGDEEAITTLEDEILETMERLEEKRLARPELLPSFPSQSSQGLASRPAAGRHQDNKLATDFDTLIATDQNRQALSPPTSFNEPTGRHGTITSGGSNATSGQYFPTRLSGRPEEIDKRYQIMQSKFFVVGWVFATLWHSGSGSTGNPDQFGSVSSGRFQENLSSHIQRMVVVKEEHGCSWCIPINTYSGRGLAKFNRFKPTRDVQRQIDAHTIIYMSDDKPSPRGDEPKMIKDPIKVTAASLDQKLDQMSRLNFAKVHTVEHNVKVMNVGRIEKDSLRKLRSYWRAQMAEELSIKDRQ